MVTSCYTSWQYRIKSTIMGRNSGEDVGEIATGRSHNANMFCISTEWDPFGTKGNRIDNFPVRD